MTSVIEERVTEVIDREASSLFDGQPLLAEIRFNSKSATKQRLWAKYTTDGNWEFLCNTWGDLNSSRKRFDLVVEKIHLIVPGPIPTNCWETAFYLAGLTASEGRSSQDEPLDKFVLEQENARRMRRVESIVDADLVAYESSMNPGSIVHAALRVEYDFVRKHLESSARMKKICARQLGLTVTPELVTQCVGYVLIERFAASFSEVDSARYTNSRVLNFAIELGKLRGYPMFYALD